MKVRVLFLLFLLLVEIIIGSLFLLKYKHYSRIVVSGKVIKLVQSDNKCIIDIGVFTATVDGRCKFRIGSKLKLIGTPASSLIGQLKGKIDLDKVSFVDFENDDLDREKKPVQDGVFSKIRNYCRDIYQSFLPKDESALLAGIVLGDKTDIGQDFYQKMVNSGSIHIAVASGFNLMLVGGTSLSVLFWFLKRKWATAAAILIMVLYAVLAGGEPPVVRALFMASILYISQAAGRKVDTGWVLFLSIWLMLIWDFSLLWNVSFQLSVAASVGLMMLCPWVVRLGNDRGYEREFGWLEKWSLLSTISVMILTTPIIWWHFGRVNLIGLLSNVLILPLVPPVMVLGVGMLVVPNLFFVPTYAVLHLLVKLIYFFGS